MRKSKFLGKVLSLALAVTLIAGMVPGMRAKAAESENSGWIHVTEENKQNAIASLPDLEGIDDMAAFFRNIYFAYEGTFEVSSGNGPFYLYGKVGKEYLLLHKEDGSTSFTQGVTLLGNVTNLNFYYYPQHTVTFNPTGGAMSVGDTETTIAGLLLALPTPTREGYLFAGWFDGYESTECVYATTVYDKDTTLYARWQKSGQKKAGNVLKQRI